MGGVSIIWYMYYIYVHLGWALEIQFFLRGVTYTTMISYLLALLNSIAFARRMSTVILALVSILYL